MPLRGLVGKYVRKDRAFGGLHITARLAQPSEVGKATEQPNGQVVVREGDYVCNGPLGDVWPMRKAAFERLYEEVKW